MPCAPALTPLAAALRCAFAAAAGLAALTPLHAAEPSLVLNPVVVTGSRAEAASFDLPAAIDVLDREQITSGQARVNASEALIAVPGLVANNRQNYAQDLQISSRGFGARSAFGVRGVKLIADGIPATMPDGQGQAATFNLDMAERIEVLRGPYSAVYGNHAGGVIQLFTIAPTATPSAEVNMAMGSYGASKVDVNAQGKPGAVGAVVDVSRFNTDGYRDHSAASREQAFVKLTGKPDEVSTLSFIVNGLWQHNTQDPLGLSYAAAQASPRSADPAATQFNTRKSIDHLQAGIAYERHIGDDLLQLATYAGQRSVIQYQAIPVAAQANPQNSGGIIDFNRNFYGFGARWIGKHQLAGGKLTTTVGLDVDNSSDQRHGYENFIGTQLGVQGRLRRDEVDSVQSTDPYVQAQWDKGDWSLTGGLRYSEVKFDVVDHYIVGANKDDSGSRNYSHTTPVLGAVYKLAPAVNLYASAARGFETPTLNEMFYSGSGAGFNFGLAPATSKHYELGAKAFVGASTRVNLALFQVSTEDELVVDTAIGGRTSYKSVGHTLRQGVELSLDTAWRRDLTSRFALSSLRAVYDQSFTTGAGVFVAQGNSIPAIARNTAFGDLAWTLLPGITATVEGVYHSKMYVEDSNAATPAPAYALANVRITAEQRMAGWRFGEFARLDNIFDRQYIGSVIVGDTNSRYYEPAPGRNGLVGVSAKFMW